MAVRCHLIQMQRALENSVCVLVLIPACNCTSDMTACVFMCMHVCKMLHASVPVHMGIPHSDRHWDTHLLLYYVCGTLCEIVCAT